MSIAESVIKRLKELDGVTPAHWELAAAILRDAAREAERWAKRPDDAMRLPDVLYEAVAGVNKAAPRKPARPKYLPGQQQFF